MGIIENMRLDGKKGFVTGAARGIGKCTATACEAGAVWQSVDLTLKKQRRRRKSSQRRQVERSLQSRQTAQTKNR